MEARAFEFRGHILLVLHDQFDLDPGRDRNLLRRELMILEHDRDLGIIGRRRYGERDERQGGNEGKSEHRSNANAIATRSQPIALRRSRQAKTAGIV